VPSGFSAASVTFVSDRQAYVLGDAPCTHAPCTSVARTLDGGRTWRGVPAPRATLQPDPGAADRIAPDSVRDLRFATGRDGYAFGGGLWTTHDGARTWRRLTSLGAVLDLATDGHTVYAVVARCGAGSWSCRDLRLMTSPVSTDAFHPVAVPVPTADQGADGAVSTAGGTTVAVLNGVTYVRRGPGGWTRATEPCRPLSGWTEPAAAGHMLTSFCSEGAAGTTYLTIQQSADNGRHWTTVPGQPVRLVNDGRSHTAIAAASARVLAVAWANRLYSGRYGGLTVSRDDGRTWTDAALPKTGAGWRYIGARSATALVALADPPTAVLWTSDTAGRSWTPHPIR
jgi:hypothetical protein